MILIIVTSPQLRVIAIPERTQLKDEVLKLLKEDIKLPENCKAADKYDFPKYKFPQQCFCAATCQGNGVSFRFPGQTPPTFSTDQ